MRRIFSGGVYEDRIGYCRAVVADGWISVSGTVCPPDPATGKPPAGVAAQCEGALAVIRRALAEAGADFSDTVRVTYMLPDAGEFEACWPVLRAAFGAHPPAATMIECGLIAPEYRIEIELTAWRAATG
ncbi:RidA family protein [Oceaniglobus trochenteri]|uniref:RidA family protein n=1 Tax=Oceaniglobus trochenteri TaxID=2763260 RepID=UPI001CFFCA7A|nr:RidA family protein [Oceaniglobus trochenteri]